MNPGVLKNMFDELGVFANTGGDFGEFKRTGGGVFGEFIRIVTRC
jgi:hypothetical protein